MCTLLRGWGTTREKQSNAKLGFDSCGIGLKNYYFGMKYIDITLLGRKICCSCYSIGLLLNCLEFNEGDKIQQITKVKPLNFNSKTVRIGNQYKRSLHWFKVRLDLSNTYFDIISNYISISAEIKYSRKKWISFWKVAGALRRPIGILRKNFIIFFPHSQSIQFTIYRIFNSYKSLKRSLQIGLDM